MVALAGCTTAASWVSLLPLLGKGHEMESVVGNDAAGSLTIVADRLSVSVEHSI